MMSFKDWVQTRRTSTNLFNDVEHMREDYESEDDVMGNTGFVYDSIFEDCDFNELCIQTYELDGKTRYLAYAANNYGYHQFDSLEEAELQTYRFTYEETTGDPWPDDPENAS